MGGDFARRFERVGVLVDTKLHDRREIFSVRLGSILPAARALSQPSHFLCLDRVKIYMDRLRAKKAPVTVFDLP